jgi:hypothetical protein
MNQERIQMTRRSITSKACWGIALFAAAAGLARADAFTLYDGKALAAVIHEDQVTLSLAARLLGRDLEALSGRKPVLSTRLADCGATCVVIGRYDSPLVSQIATEAGLDLATLRGQWERYARVAVRSRHDPKQTWLLVAGSDPRGAVYGVVDLTRELGISAWEWWADVTPRKAGRLAVDGAKLLSEPPSVQYRGIFLNDEDWGLQPWAAKTFDRASGDIGPATYARIYELLWRLKANTIWPAMHDSTKPFYQLAGNPEMARDYGIVVGTSHAEPMMRNNVREWNGKTQGPFNFFTNRAAMIGYWQSRVEAVKDFENMYSVGLRGVHDSAMEGAATVEQARDGVSDVIGIQRELLGKAQRRPPQQIPQALTLYKEVLDIYKAGLKVPEDITLVWPDDNYGYLQQLSTPAEAKRAGGTGVYYHISYWGRPHDYLWLGTTHPALIREQMDRAFQTGSRKTWIVNVGDIKPGEYLTQYFLDLAFDRKAFEQAPHAHLQAWVARQFGEAHAKEIAAILTAYYDLAWERRPEFMGFGQTEPTTPNRQSDYLQTGGEEAERRIARYEGIVRRAEAAGAALPADRHDAFFELVLYPVRASASMNARVLKLELAGQYARQGRPSANLYASQARAAHEAIVRDSGHYNALAGGKWRHMMDMAPRRLPVFDQPLYPAWTAASRQACTLAYPAPYSPLARTLNFTIGHPEMKTVTLVGGAHAAQWKAHASNPSLTLSASAGTLDDSNGFEQRIDVRYDGTRAAGGLTLECGAQALQVATRFLPAAPTGMAAERDRIVSMAATRANANALWETVPGLGSQGASLRSSLALQSVDAKAAASIAPLTYDFVSTTAGPAQLKVVAVPAHPLSSAQQLRLGVSLDEGPIEILDFATRGRSEEWKLNVLSNSAVKSKSYAQLAAGSHRLKVYALDPGFILDRIEVEMDGAPRYYGAPP